MTTNFKDLKKDKKPEKIFKKGWLQIIQSIFRTVTLKRYYKCSYL